MASEPRTHLVIDTMTSTASLADIVGAALQTQTNDYASVCLVGNAEKLEASVRLHGGQLSDVDIIHAPVWIQSRDNGARAVKIHDDTSMQVAAATSLKNHGLFVTFGNGNALREVVRTHFAESGRLCPFAGQICQGTTVHTILDIGSFVFTGGSQLANFGSMGAALHRLTTKTVSPTVGLVTSERSISHCSEEIRDAHRVLHERCSSYLGLTDPSDTTTRLPDVLVTTSRSGKLLYDLLGRRLESVQPQLDRGIGWRGLFNRTPASSRSIPFHLSSSLLVGGSRPVAYRAGLSSPADILSTFKDILHVSRLGIVSEIQAELERAVQPVARTTREQPRVNV